MILNKSVSLSDQVFERIEEDILTGKYTRGTILTELGLCADLGVSRTPVREAIHRLEQEHIIESTGKGLLVLSITPEDADVIYMIRSRIEGLAAAACAANVTDEQLQEMLGILEMQEYFAKKHDAEKIKQFDSQFHEKIYRYSGSAVYYDTLMPLHKKTQKFRKASVASGNRAADSTAEHRRIYEAIAKHDPTEAEMMMYEHIKNAHRNLVENIIVRDGNNGGDAR